MKKTFFLVFLFSLFSCAELQQIANELPQEGGLSDLQIADGLREALDKGIDKQVSKLTSEGGFLNNELVRITLPPELQKVDRTLRDVGMDALADEGLAILNRAAEEAVKEATPIFISAVREITFSDARNILMGNETAATDFLAQRTSNQLYEKFNPVVRGSLDRVGATQVWSNIISKYNNLPLTSNVNPDLPDYVTTEAMEGVFTMIALEEKEIRTHLSARTSSLLRKVFALQD